MRQVSLLIVLLASACTSPRSAESQSREVEASCGQCQFALPGDGCDLAVRLGDRAYFVDGAGIDEHGDAHADDGFCNAVRRARVSGQVEGERFLATSFELLPEEGD